MLEALRTALAHAGVDGVVSSLDDGSLAVIVPCSGNPHAAADAVKRCGIALGLAPRASFGAVVRDGGPIVEVLFDAPAASFRMFLGDAPSSSEAEPVEIISHVAPHTDGSHDHGQ